MATVSHSNLQPNRFSLPGFSQLLDAIVDREIERVDAVFCSHETAESSVGACDGGDPCNKKATCGDFCAKHAGTR